VSTKNVVIYCRYSTDMQRNESCADQEREVRAALARLGIDATKAIVIRDQAVSGTKSARTGFQELIEMVARREINVLAVDDQARLTRSENAYAFITDLVYSGGRFISTGEGIDTSSTGWQLRVQVMELSNGLEVRGLQHKVRRGQEGRVRDDGSAGDFPFGYDSYYIDADWAEQLARRGPKPKKGLRVSEEEAKQVRQVFEWFVDAKSIGWIARELTRLKVHKGHRASTPGWHPQQIRRMLANEKYVGKWVWGETTTQRNSRGQKKQVEVPADQLVSRNRPNLRIVEQELWDRAVVRLAKLEETFGRKAGQKPRGPKWQPNPADIYPRSPLGGLVVCGCCQAKLWQSRSNSRCYYACPGAKKGLCNMATQVPATRAENALVAFLLDLLRVWPGWMRLVYRQTCEAVRVAAARVPQDRERDFQRTAELSRQIENLINALANGCLTSPAITGRLRDAEREKAELDARLAGYHNADRSKAQMPDETQVAQLFEEWVNRLATDPGSLLRVALSSVAADPVIVPGKKRGFARLRFRVRAWETLVAALGEHLPAAVLSQLPKLEAGQGDEPEFTIDLGEPTTMDRWTPEIVAWRAAGVTWKEIVHRTGMDLNRVFIAWKRATGATDSHPAA